MQLCKIIRPGLQQNNVIFMGKKFPYEEKRRIETRVKFSSFKLSLTMNPQTKAEFEKLLVCNLIT